MQNSEHIAEESLDACGKRKLVPAEALAVQKHIAWCEMCREKLARKLDAAKMFSAFGREFAFEDFAEIDPEHLAYEQLALFVAEKPDAVEREIAESHFAVCAACSKDLADLTVSSDCRRADFGERSEKVRRRNARQIALAASVRVRFNRRLHARRGGNFDGGVIRRVVFVAQ